MKHLVHIRHSNSMSRIASPSSHSSVFKLRPNFIVACLTAKVSSWVHGNRRRICTSGAGGRGDPGADFEPAILPFQGMRRQAVAADHFHALPGVSVFTLRAAAVEQGSRCQCFPNLRVFSPGPSAPPVVAKGNVRRRASPTGARPCIWP